MIKVKMINKSANPLPKYETAGSAGMDLRANISEEIELKSLERKLIPTGLFMELPNGYEAQIRARSGLSIKHGITMINAVGTIDSDYRGEIKIPLVNISNETYKIAPGERVAQMVIVKYETADVIEVEEIDETNRGVGGFGSTGK